MIYCFYIIIVHYYINDKYYSVVVSCNVSTIVKKKILINTQEELHTQKRMQFDKVLITMGITLESSKIKISIVIALAIFHLLCTF